MENENQETNDFSILSNVEVAAVFADLNLKLLSGRHILSDDYSVFRILDRFSDELAQYYRALYSLKLEADKKDGEVYYYLDFFEAGKGKMADPSRHRILTENQTVIGIVLLNLYYSRFLQQTKQLTWQEILREIMQGELKDLYHKAFFNHASNAHSPDEMRQLEKNWKTAIKSFEELGWVKILSGENEELRFEIKPSIHRLEKLYGEELTHFDEFVQRVSIKKSQNELPANQ